MNWAYFIEKQQQQQYAITTTKQKTKQNQTNKPWKKTKTAKTFRFNEMIFLRISTFAFFSQTTSPRGVGAAKYWLLYVPL